jgi:PAS domain S-box-containing protein
MEKKQIHVLLLEDEAAHVEAIRRALASADSSLKVHVVSSIKEFREYVAVNSPDIALLDMVLPDGNGIEMLKSPPEQNAFPMLVLTSHGNEQAAVAALKAGALDYVVKSPEAFADMPRILTRNLNQWTLIRERNLAEESLKLSGQNFRNSMEGSFIGIYIADKDWNPSFANQAFLDIFGYKNLDEVKAKHPSEFYTPESSTESEIRAEQRTRGEPTPNQIEITITREDGSIRHLQAFRQTILWDGKQQYQLLYNDITKRKQAEEALRESERRLQEAQQMAHLGFWDWDVKMGDVKWSDEVFHIFGLDPKNFTPQIDSILALSPWPADHQRDQELIDRAVKSHSPGSYEQKFLRPDNSIGYYYSNFQGNYDSHGELISIVGTVLDVTDRKKTEEEINRLMAIESQTANEWQKTFDAISDIVAIISPSHEIIRINKAGCLAAGKQPEELIGKKCYEAIHGTGAPIKMCSCEAALKTKQICTSEIVEAGKHFQLTAYPVFDKRGEIVSFAHIVKDITARKHTEEALQRSESYLRATMDSTGDGILVVDDQQRIVSTNNRFAEMFNIPRELISKKEDGPVLAHVVAQVMDSETFLTKVKRLYITNEKDIDRLYLKNGNVFERYSEPLMLNNKIAGRVWSFRDITKLINSEIALRDSEEKYRLIVEKSSDVLFTFNAAGDFTYLSPSVKNLLGYNQDEFIGRPFASLIHPDDLQELQQAIQRNIKDGSQTPGGNRYRIRHASGEWRWHNASGNAVYDTDGKYIYFVGISKDITGHKRAEEELQASEEKYSTLIEQSTDGIVILDDRTVLFANRQMNEMTGYSQTEIIGKYFYDLAAPEYRTMLEELYLSRKGSHEPSANRELELLAKDGSKVPVDTKLQPIMYKGKAAGMVIIHDIAERKKAEQALKASEQNFRNSIDNSLMGIRIVDAEWRTLYVNQVFLDIFGYKNTGEVSATPLQDHYTPEERIRHLQREERQKNGEPIQTDLEVDILRNDGDVRRIQVFLKEIFWSGKKQRQIIFNDITERKKAEEAVKLSEQNFRNSMDTSMYGVRIVDAKWHTLYANQEYLDIHGYRNIAEADASKPKDIFTPAEYTRYLKRRERAARGEPEPATIEMELVRRDGAIRHVLVSRKEVLWNGQKQFQILYNDITDRRLAEEALKISEQNFRNSMDTSTIGIRISDRENNNLYANQAMLDIFGYKNAGEIDNTPPYHLYSPESHAAYRLRNEKFLRGEPMPKQVEIDIIRKGGSLRNLQVSMSEVFWGGKPQYQTLYNDITELKQSEAARQESEEKYRLIVENNRDMIFTVNEDEEYVYVSPAVTSMLGYQPSELIGNRFISYVHPDDRHVIEEEIKRTYTVGYKVSGDSEYRMRQASGSWLWVVSRGSRVIDKNGELLYFIGIIRDITEHKMAEEEKRRLEEKAQVASRLAAVGEMAAGIAHEINNPLTGVLGFSQMLMEKKDVPDDIKEALALIADGSSRVADIVKRLLTFARQTKPVKTLASLNELIENTLKLREYVLRTNNIKVITVFDPELPWSVVDPGQMQQVFLNLIVNAEQAMKKANGKGTLTIRTEKKNNDIRLIFQDDGPGITKENMGHLFEPFFTTKEPGEGTGLGLSLSRSIILEHNGKMSVESEFGRGVTFILELPLVEALPAEGVATVAEQNTQNAAVKSGKIMVVDDEPGVRALLEKSLKKVGYTVDTFGDAGTANDKIDSGAIYDVILTDVRMPGMNGIEFYSRIIEQTPAMKNKFIFITGDIMGVDIKTFLGQNKLPYLAKPFSVDSLKEKINAIMLVGQQEKNNSTRKDNKE